MDKFSARISLTVRSKVGRSGTDETAERLVAEMRKRYINGSLSSWIVEVLLEKMQRDVVAGGLDKLVDSGTVPVEKGRAVQPAKPKNAAPVRSERDEVRLEVVPAEVVEPKVQTDGEVGTVGLESEEVVESIQEIKLNSGLRIM